MRGPTRIVVLVCAVILLAVLAVPAPVNAHHLPGPCDVHQRHGETVREYSKRLIRCAVGLWPVGGGPTKAICIADAESHLNPGTKSAGGTYLGLFQQSAVEWPDRFDTSTRRAWKLDPSALSGRSNAIVTIRMVNANGWGSWRGVGDC